MKVSHLKQVIEDMPNDAILFVGIIDKDEANHILELASVVVV